MEKQIEILRKIASDKEAYAKEYIEQFNIDIFELVHFLEHPKIRLLAENENLIVLNDCLCVGSISSFRNFKDSIIEDTEFDSFEDLEKYINSIPIDNIDNEYLLVAYDIYKLVSQVFYNFEADTEQYNEIFVVDAENALFLFLCK